MLIGITIMAIVVLAVLALAAGKPDDFRAERSREIAGPPERIRPLIQDFRAWTRWSPYENKDPNMKRTYSGASAGVGSVYAWEGNKEVGSGRMEILAAESTKTTIKLDFLKPMEAHSTAEFLLTPTEKGTRVTWAMFGKMNFVCKIISVFVSTEKMCAKDFDAGLAALDAAVTGRDVDAKAAAAPLLTAQ